MPLQPPVSYRDFPDFRRGQTGGGSANLLNMLTNLKQKKIADARYEEEQRKEAERQKIEDDRYDTKEAREDEKWEATKEADNYKQTKETFEEYLPKWRLDDPEAATEDIARDIDALSSRLHGIWGDELPKDVQNNLDKIGGIAGVGGDSVGGGVGGGIGATALGVLPARRNPVAQGQSANMLGAAGQGVDPGFVGPPAPGQGLPGPVGAGAGMGGPPQQAAPQAAPKPDVLSGLRMWKESIAKAPVVGSERWEKAEIFKENLKTPGHGSQFRAVGPDGTERFYRINKKTNKAEPVEELLPPPKSEESITVGPDGTVSIKRGVGVASGGISDKVTERKITAKLIDKSESLSRLNSIKGMYKPTYQKFSTQVGQLWSAAKEKYLGMKLSPEDAQELKDYTQYRQTVIEHLNLYIKDITGAQMSEAEAKRLGKAVPNAEKDSPTEFEGKLENSIRTGQLAVARYQYLLREGFTDAAISKLMEPVDPKKPELGAPIDRVLPLDKFKQVMKKREDEMVQENPNISDEELKKKLREEFYGD